MLLNHFIVTRFSYRDTAAHFGRLVVKSNASTANPLAAHRLEKRFTLFEVLCLPSILAQTSQDFTWLLLIDPELKQKYRNRLRDLTKAHPRTHLVEVKSVASLASLDWLKPYAEHGQARHIATTNVDDDDILAPGMLEYAQQYLHRLHEEGRLPGCQVVGCTHPIQWDFLPTWGAPLGHLKPSLGRVFPSFTGYTVCCTLPQYDFSALAFEHQFGGAYFDPKVELHSETQTRIRAAAERAGEDWRTWRVEDRYHMMQPEHPQVVLVNHVENDYIIRLFEDWSTRRPVTGPADFPGMPIDFDRARTAIRAFRRKPLTILRHMYKGARMAVVTKRWTGRTRRRILLQSLMAPLWFIKGLPERGPRAS